MESKNKMIMAVVQEDDYDTTVSELNKQGFFVTMLSSTGGFWKKKNITIMLGVEADKLEQALDILKRCAGKRQQTIYSNVAMPTGSHALGAGEGRAGRRDRVCDGPGEAGKVLSRENHPCDRVCLDKSGGDMLPSHYK